MKSLWTLNDVSLAGRQSPRLDGVTLQIAHGVTAIIGQSGAGKTSLLNLLVDFERPDRGRVEFHGSTTGLPIYWSPPTYGLWPHLSVREHLSTVSSTPQDAAQIEQLLSAFDLIRLADARPGSLSLGERSRLSVARAVASRAGVLAMDEPLAHVDPARFGAYWDAIREHCSAHQTSLVFATHSPEVVLREADHVVCLTEGKVSYAGDVQDLYEQPASVELALMLGPCNWLSNDEGPRWIPARQDLASSNGCVRPERLSICLDQSGPAKVEAARFAGSSEEVDLVHLQDGSRRTFIHRPAGRRLQAGDHVLLKVLLLFVALLMSGCDFGAEPTLAVKSETYWSMPPEGLRVPAPRGMTVAPDGEYLVLDNAGRVLAFDSTGKLRRHWWMPDYSVGKPEGICVLKDGRIAVADTHYHRVVLFNHDGEVVGMFGKLGTGPGEFIYPVCVVQDDKENLYVCGSNWIVWDRGRAISKAQRCRVV
jgi:ABC-type multidrug transport system ATPase subunit